MFGVPKLGGYGSPQEPLQSLRVLRFPPEDGPGKTEFRGASAGLRIGVLGHDPIGQRARSGLIEPEHRVLEMGLAQRLLLISRPAQCFPQSACRCGRRAALDVPLLRDRVDARRSRIREPPPPTSMRVIGRPASQGRTPISAAIHLRPRNPGLRAGVAALAYRGPILRVA